MYNQDSYKKPFWAENSGFMTGRDPLGVQNSSITAYGRLLPGMTNLTLRLRYYGLYMWVLDEFFKKEGGNEDFNLRDQHNFIRRAELIIAYIMRHLDPEEQSIIGSNFTNDKAIEVEESGYYEISKGADQYDTTVKGSVYWDYRSGALGQYYAGSLAALNLISIDDKYFSLKAKGKDLAAAFRKSLTPSQEKLFLDQLNEGKLSLDQINDLDLFKINSIRIASDEWTFYLKLLIDFDGNGIEDANNQPTRMRKDSVALLLNYMSSENKEYNDRSFILSEYLNNTNHLKKDASLGWYYYYLNESFHFALETVFWAILIKLDGKPMPVNQFINESVNELLKVFEESESYTATDTVEAIVIGLSSKPMHEALEELEKTVQSYSNHSIAFAKALELMFLIYLQIEGQITVIKDFESLYYISRQRGRVSENYEHYVNSKLDLTLQQFVKNIIKQLMNDHVNIAYRKMGNGESNLLKFVIEDGIISHIQTMQPRHTSPRLKTITNFLRDLSLVDSDNLITNSGKELLKELSA